MDQWLPGVRDGVEERWGEQVAKRYKDTFGGDKQIHYLDCGNDSWL